MSCLAWSAVLLLWVCLLLGGLTGSVCASFWLGGSSLIRIGTCLTGNGRSAEFTLLSKVTYWSIVKSDDQHDDSTSFLVVALNSNFSCPLLSSRFSFVHVVSCNGLPCWWWQTLAALEPLRHELAGVYWYLYPVIIVLWLDRPVAYESSVKFRWYWEHDFMESHCLLD